MREVRRVRVKETKREERFKERVISAAKKSSERSPEKYG